MGKNKNHTPITGTPVIKTAINTALSSLDAAIGAIGTVEKAVLSDTKTSATDGQSTSSTTWNVRNLNTEDSDSAGIVSISSNRFTPESGTYLLIADCTTYASNAARLALYNVTGTSYVAYGNGVDSANMIGMNLMCTFTANGTDAYEIRHYTETGNSTGGGYDDSAATVEVYLQVALLKIGA